MIKIQIMAAWLRGKIEAFVHDIHPATATRIEKRYTTEPLVTANTSGYNGATWKKTYHQAMHRYRLEAHLSIPGREYVEGGIKVVLLGRSTSLALWFPTLEAARRKEEKLNGEGYSTRILCP